MLESVRMFKEHSPSIEKVQEPKTSKDNQFSFSNFMIVYDFSRKVILYDYSLFLLLYFGMISTVYTLMNNMIWVKHKTVHPEKSEHLVSHRDSMGLKDHVNQDTWQH